MAYVRVFPFFPKFSGYLHDRSGVLSATLVWNTFALTLGTIYLYKILESLRLPQAVFISGIFSAIIFALLGDLLPKTIAVIKPEAVFNFLVYPFVLMYLPLRFLGITKFASLIVESKYSRDEVLDLTSAGFKEHLDERDINFIRNVISALHKPAKHFISKDGIASEKIDGNSRCLDAIVFMRKRGISRVGIGEEGVFDLHEFVRKISQSHL